MVQHQIREYYNLHYQQNLKLMFEKSFELRMAAWRKFRESLETSNDPFKDVIFFYKSAPYVSMHTDPWDQKTWPAPWQLLDENRYCEFAIVLGMCYSLQLTDKFKPSNFEIHISTNNKTSESYYLLCIDNLVIGYNTDAVVYRDDLPDALYSQRIYCMPRLH
jgi:hypothetical protein